MTLTLDQLRREYTYGGLQREQLKDNPLAQFTFWMEQAVASGITDPTAMTLATVDATGQPSQRIVLLKGLDIQGFVFFTNIESRKARELAVNNQVSLHFPWHGLDRQVKVCGVAMPLTRTAVLKYFSSRPRDSQIAAWASKQSSPISTRKVLMAQFASMQNKFSKGKIPLPDFWGGYCVKPHQIEFWQGGEHRLHDCFQYNLKENEQWSIERLEP